MTATQLLTGRCWAALSSGLVHLARLGPGAASLTGRADPVQAVASFDVAARGLGEGVVVARPDRAPVLPNQGRDHVNVIVRVPDGDPPHSMRVAVTGQADLGDDLGGDVSPLLVGQHTVGGVGADGAVPHRLAGWVASGPDGNLQKVDQVPEVAPPGHGQGGFEVGQVAGAVPYGTRWGLVCSSRLPGPYR